MKKLGLGLMRLPVTDSDNRSTIDIDAVCRMADEFISAGFTYFDTAYMYHDGKSENAFKEAVALRYPRDSYVLADKLPMWHVHDEGDPEKIFNEQLEKCGVEYFDYYLLHSMNKGNIEAANKYGAFDFVQKKKADGFIRHVGFSFHDSAKVLDELLTAHPEMEFVQLQINYMDWENDKIQSRKCYEVARRHGKDIIVMEPVKGGALATAPVEAEKLLLEREPDMSIASWALRYTAGLDGVFMVLSGMSNMEQLRDNMSFMSDPTPLSADDTALLMKTLEIRANPPIPCTSCEYCVEGCPAGIQIPKFLALYNSAFMKGSSAPEWEMKEYAKLSSEGSAASACISCKACETVCPQHIEIADFLGKTAQTLER